MAVVIYTFFCWLYKIAAYSVAPFDSKAKKWVEGRKNIFERLEQAIKPGGKIIWIHCASLGEFEQGRPLIENIKKEYPAYQILLTFFSSSGYEVQKNYKGADWIFYLPMDGPRNARRFLSIAKPSLVIFVKYEFWYYFLRQVYSEKIPLLLISASFRKDAVFFKWHGGFYRRILSFFNHLFLQNEQSRELLGTIGMSSCSVSGDTRFDRVAGIAEKAERFPVIEQFIGKSTVIVAGSTWPEDEKVLQEALSRINDTSLKLIIAPHEIHEKHLTELEKLFPTGIRFSIFTNTYSPLTTSYSPSNVLIIDNIGMLAGLYKYAYITYVGGGFRNGLHNILEAAANYKPVLFGPVIQNYPEALDLVRSGGGISFHDAGELEEILLRLLRNQDEHGKCCSAAGDFIQANRGATKKIMHYIQENRLLTS